MMGVMVRINTLRMNERVSVVQEVMQLQIERSYGGNPEELPRLPLAATRQPSSSFVTCLQHCYYTNRIAWRVRSHVFWVSGISGRWA